MKTLTEFAGALIRNAHKAVAEASRNLPKEAAAPAPAPAAEPTPAPAVEAAPAADAAAAAPVADAAAAAPAADAPAAEAKPAEAAEAKPAAPAEPTESDAVKTALDEAVAKATGLSGDRLSRLREALKAVGKRADDVRLVRVFSSEEPVPGSKKVGEFQYIVEYMPASMKQVMTAPDRDKGGRRGPPRPGQGNAANTTGGFSMDAVKADRQAERRGGGGGRPGGGRPGGGRPGGGGRPAGGGRRGQ